ncbi:MAG: GAF domain-containing protein [Gemmatimonadetes bacterium]|nr:GAF domain-containing protein [Gemmatimonadota bacterium]
MAKWPGYVPGLSAGAEVDVPLMIDGTTIGVLVIESETRDAFGREDLEILGAAANQASIAIGRMRLAQAQNRLLDGDRDLISRALREASRTPGCLAASRTPDPRGSTPA